jgi:hypothetical protein
MLFGFVGLALFIYVVSRVRLPVERSGVFSIQLFLTSMFCLATGLITALGRSSFGITQAFSSRYQTFALLFWWALLMLLLMPLFRNMQSQLPIVIAEACLLAIMLGGIRLAGDAVRHARLHGFELNLAAAALLTDTPDRAQFKLIVPDPNSALQLAPYMRERRLSIFFDDAGLRLGERLDSVFHVVAPPEDECVGAVQSVTAVEGDAQALKVTGWAWDRVHRRPPTEIVAAADGVIVGLGAMDDWRPNLRATHPYLKTSFVGFTGYVRNAQPSAPVTIYAVLGASPPEACPIATLNYSEVK